MKEVNGGIFGSGFDPTQIISQDWGTVSIEYNGCDEFKLNYNAKQPYNIGGPLNAKRLLKIDQLTCSP